MAHPPIYFLRHGQTEWNAQRRLQGQLDSPLTALGRDHAAAQARLLAPILDQDVPVFCSPLGRALETAAIAVPDGSFTVDKRLSEVHAGAWEGLTHAQIEAGWPDLYASNARGLDLYCAAPDGEGYTALQARIADFVAGCTGPSVIIAHGLWGQVLRGLVCGIDRAGQAELSNQQGVIYHLDGSREIVLR